MRRLATVLLLILLVAGMNVRTVWSGGGKWGSGTPSGARTDAYWLPDGQTPADRPFPDVAIGGTLLTDSLMAASWSLGISDFLADLSPNTASLTFKGQVSGTPGDDVVISTGLGVQWSGRLDTVTQTRDTAGNWWTSITATDRVGALGASELDAYAFPGSIDLLDHVAAASADSGVSVTITDDSIHGLGLLQEAAEDPYSGSLLAYINGMLRSQNAMAALQRDGTISAVIREAVTPSPVLTLSGVNAPRDWTLSYSIDVDINRWSVWTTIGPYTDILFGEDAGDIKIYGARSFVSDRFRPFSDTYFDDWIAYGGSQRPTASATLVVTDWSQDDLILLDPFQWITESGTDWQVLSVQHSVTASPYSWAVTMTLDNLLDLL